MYRAFLERGQIHFLSDAQLKKMHAAWDDVPTDWQAFPYYDGEPEDIWHKLEARGLTDKYCIRFYADNAADLQRFLEMVEIEEAA